MTGRMMAGVAAMSEMDGERVARVASGWLGTPFQHQGQCKGVGVDCLGLVIGVLRECGYPIGLTVPNYPRDLIAFDGHQLLTDGLVRTLDPVVGEIGHGDILGFRIGRSPAMRHLGISLSHGLKTFAHAHTNRGVTAVHVGAGWHRRFVRAFRVRQLPSEI